MATFSAEHLLNACNSFPESAQPEIKEILEQWRVADARKLNLAVNKIRETGLFANLPQPSLELFDEILTAMLKINQVRVSLEIHNDLLELTSLYLSACEQKSAPPSFTFIDTLFKGASRLLISGYDNINPLAISMHRDGLRHLQIMTDFVRSPIFAAFVKKGPDKPSQINQEAAGQNFDAGELAAFCISDLQGLLHTRRCEFFIARLNFTLELLEKCPETRSELATLPQLITWAMQLLDFGQGSIDKIASAISVSAPGLPADFGAKLEEALSEGKKGSLPDPVKEKIPLTTEFIYREALKDMYGDGVFTEREKESLEKLRQYLEISPETYEKIFAEVSKMPLITDYEFDPYVFFFNLTNKAMRDSKLEESEKKLLVKVANALNLEKDAAHEIFAESLRQAPKPEEKIPVADPEFDDTLTSWRLSIRLRHALKNFRHAAEIHKIGEELAQKSAENYRKQRMRSVGGLNTAIDEPDNASILFVYEPELFPLPLFMLLTSDEERETIRLRLKGEDISLRGCAAVGQDMKILNRTLDQSAPLSFCQNTEFKTFKATMQQALSDSHGSYAVALVPFPSGNPAFMKVVHGSIEFSGALDKAETLIGRKNFSEACELLKELAEKSSEVADIWFTLGNVYRNMAGQSTGTEAERNLQLAFESYTRLSEKWPALAEGWAGIGMVKRQQGNLDEAMAYLEKALRLKPVSVTNSLTYAFYGLLKYQNEAPKLLEFLKNRLTPVYNFMPMHPQTSDFLKQVEEKFGFQLRHLLEMTEVNSRYQ